MCMNNSNYVISMFGISDIRSGEIKKSPRKCYFKKKTGETWVRNLPLITLYLQN